MTNRTVFSRINAKMDNFTTYTSFFGHFLPETSVYLIFLPEFLDFSVGWFAAAAGN